MANGSFATPTGTGVVGSDSNPYLIEDGYDLAAIAKDLAGTYKLVKSIDLTKICNDSDGTGWTPIANFTGTLEGNGYVIKNLFINRSTTENQALFSSIRGANLRNFGVIDASVTGGNSSAIVVGNSQSYNDVIQNVFSTGSVISTTNIAGLVGTMQGGKIKNCYSEANLTCTNTSTSYAGGLVYTMTDNYSNIENSYFNGTITGATSVSPYVNVNSIGGTVTDCHYNSDNLVMSTKATGALSNSEMKTASSFDSWANEYYNFDKKIWVLLDNNYPKLYYTEATKYFIAVTETDGTVKYLTFSDNNWVTLENDDGSAVNFPTDTQFAYHGINDMELENISRFKWNELRTYEEFELIASTDKYIVNREVETKKMEISDTLTDAIILSTTIDFSKYGDSINQIKILQ